MKQVMLLAAATAIVGAPALAQTAGDAGGHASIAISGGTLGVGPELGYRVSSHFGVRASATFLGISHGFDSDDVDYHGKVRLRSYGLMADLYPMGGHFRVSAGARVNRNHAGVTATPTVATDIGNTTYTPAQIGTITGRGEVKKFAPALTLGWAGSNQRGFFFGVDAGALFQGKVRVRRFGSTGTLANNASFQADLERERQDLQGDVDDYKVYPIAQLSIGFRF